MSLRDKSSTMRLSLSTSQVKLKVSLTWITQLKRFKKCLSQDLLNLEKGDIQEVLNMSHDFSLIEIKPEAREKYGGRHQVAASLKRLGVSPLKNEKQMRTGRQRLYEGTES